MKDERYLRLLENDKLLSNGKLLEKDESVSVHHRNIQSVTIEILLIKQCQCSEIITNIFTKVIHEVKIRKNQNCRITFMNTVFHGSESTCY